MFGSISLTFNLWVMREITNINLLDEELDVLEKSSTSAYNGVKEVMQQVTEKKNEKSAVENEVDDKKNDGKILVKKRKIEKDNSIDNKKSTSTSKVSIPDNLYLKLRKVKIGLELFENERISLTEIITSACTVYVEKYDYILKTFEKIKK